MTDDPSPSDLDTLMHRIYTEVNPTPPLDLPSFPEGIPLLVAGLRAARNRKAAGIKPSRAKSEAKVSLDLDAILPGRATAGVQSTGLASRFKRGNPQ